MIETPYYPLVPKTLEANLKFRRRMVLEGADDPDAAAQIRTMCSRDVLFFVNAFCWTFDPRKKEPIIPFITYEFQDEAIYELHQCMGVEDVAIEKSRDMGATWMLLLVMFHAWIFRPMQSFLLVSRNEDLVDKKNEPDSMFWKIDFLLDHLPEWLKPKFTRQRLSLHNDSNRSSFTGTSTTSETSRGGRKTAIGLDEFASVENGHDMLKATRDATNCRFFNSTPKGTGNAFYDVIRSSIKKLRMHWTKHPEKASGLYADESGKPRSPWYDKQCERSVHPMEIAQELDIDYLGSDFQFFDQTVLDKIQQQLVRDPLLEGDLDYDADTLEPFGFIERANGRIKLWMNVGESGRVQSDQKFVAAADISAGTGSSNSTLSVADVKTNEKVLEIAVADLRPDQFATLVVAVCRWLNNARLVWEANGPGRIFGNRVIELGYRFVYYKTTDDRSMSATTTAIPGWYASPESKLALLGEYRRAITSGDFVNRSYMSIREAREYVFFSNGRVGHSRSASNIDPSGARDNHGDRVTADALCWKLLKGAYTPPKQEDEVPVNSLAWRRNQRAFRRRSDREESGVWA